MKRIGPMTDLAPYAAVFLDIAAWDPDLRPSLSRDYERLLKVASTRGMSFCMIDMPEAGKIVDLSLSRGRFDRSSLPKTFGRGIFRDDRGYFLKHLFEKVFAPDGYLREDVDVQSIFFLRQVLYMAKKVDIPCEDLAVDAAVLDFVRIEGQLRRPTLSWDLDEIDSHRSNQLSFLDGYKVEPDLVSHRDTISRKLLRFLDQVCEITLCVIPQLDWRDLVPRHGPGAVCDVKSGTDKYRFPNWPRKLGLVFPYEYFAQHREDLHLYNEKLTSPSEPFARLCAVPKTLKGPRLITVEPVAHQFLQQGLLRWIRKTLPDPLRLCVDFSNQTLSKDAALAASLDGESATIDLSSASDRLSCWIIERMFGKCCPSIISALHASRTRGISYTMNNEVGYLIMKKYAGQGNATTFPVQSMFYALVGIASLLFESGRAPSSSSIRWAARQIRVFGDDIIMPSFAVRSLVDLLSYTGLKVNMSKTHVSGHFRESCGMDAYGGVDVTPLYIRAFSLDESPEDLVSWIDVCNNAYHKGLWVLADWMRSQIPDKHLELIPVSNKPLDCLALLSYQDCLSVSSKSRYNVYLHREEFLALQGSSKTVTKRREGHENLLQYFLEAPAPDHLGVFPEWGSGFLVKSRLLLRRRWVPYR